MKSALSLTLIVCLVASALPAAAQEHTETRGSFDIRGPAAQTMAERPLTRAAMREALRARSDWSRVRKLAPGTEVVVTVRGSKPGKRSLVLADESDLTVLNLTVPTLPRAATRLLQNIASSHDPDVFVGTATSGRFVDQDVRVAPDGVFVAGRKVADLGQVVEHIARIDVAEIRTPKSRRFRHTLVGMSVGFLVGVMLERDQGSCLKASSECVPLALDGILFGGLLGAQHDERAARGDVIYRAP